MRSSITLITLGCALLAAGGCSQEGATPPPVPKPLTTLPGQPPDPTPPKRDASLPDIVEDIVFGKSGGVELKLDLARPAGEGPFPAVVCLHGGSWAAGSKRSYHGLMMELARRGIVAASVDYRLAPDFQFPSQIEDAKCSVRYLRAEAKKWNIDPARIAALGDSSGAQLALLLGLMGPDDGLEGDGGNPKESSRVIAVVNMYGRSDFTVPGSFPLGGEIYFKNYLGTADHAAPVMKRASPMTYVSKDDPPVLTLQGAQDDLIPPMLAKRLHEALKKAGVEEHAEFFANSAHNYWDNADWERAVKMAIAFLEKQLKPK